MRRFQYPATLIPEKKKGFTVRFSDLPEAITSGTNRRDALVQAADCLEEAIAGRITDGLEIPKASAPRRNQVLVAVPSPTAAKAALYLAMRDAKMKNTELARRLGCDEKEVRRMLNPRHATKLPRIQEALEALGMRLIVSVEEEAA
jgi:antitoxin HicB